MVLIPTLLLVSDFFSLKKAKERKVITQQLQLEIDLMMSPSYTKIFCDICVIFNKDTFKYYMVL